MKKILVTIIMLVSLVVGAVNVNAANLALESTLDSAVIISGPSGDFKKIIDEHFPKY